MRYRVTHTTTYAYEELVSICHNEMRLEPRSAPRQQCLATALAIDPTPAVLTTDLDYFGNRASFFTVQEPHHRMLVTARSELEIASVRIALMRSKSDGSDPRALLSRLGRGFRLRVGMFIVSSAF